MWNIYIPKIIISFGIKELMKKKETKDIVRIFAQIDEKIIDEHWVRISQKKTQRQLISTTSTLSSRLNKS